MPVARRLDVRGERQRQIGELLVVAPELAVRGAQHQPLPAGDVRALRRRAHRRTGRSPRARRRRRTRSRATAARRTPRCRSCAPSRRGAATCRRARCRRLSRSTVSPVLARRPHRRDLLGRQDRERHAELDQRLQRRRVDTPVSGSHSPSAARPKRRRKSCSPHSSCVRRSRASQQRHDRVRVGLRHRAAVAAGAAAARRRPRAAAGAPSRSCRSIQRASVGPKLNDMPRVVVDDRLDAARRRRGCARRRWRGSTRRGCARSSRGTAPPTARAAISSVHGFSRGG